MVRRAPAAVILSSCLLGFAAAQSSIITLVLPGFDAQAIEGSVISVSPTATAYFLACPPGTDATDCGLGDGLTLTEGPSTVEFHLTDAFDVSCAVTTNVAVCAETITSEGPLVTTVETFSDYSSLTLPVTITAGLDLLTAGGSATPTASSTPQTTGASAAVSTSAGSTETGSASGSGSISATSRTSAAGVPRITQNAILAGAALAVGGAIML